MLTRVPLAGGWSLWPQLLVRAAGFPISQVEPLVAPQSALLADAVQSADSAAARAAFEAAYGLERQRWSAHLRVVASDPRFREAVLWQNRKAVEDGLDSLLRQPPQASDARTRKKEALVTSYLQRYATKCDTIGFFGPLGWGRWQSHPEAIRQRPAPTLLDARATWFEPWAIAAVARAFADDWQVRRWLKPRLPGELRLQRRLLHGVPGGRGRGGALTLPVKEARLLKRCDGTRTADQVGSRALLEELAGRGWVQWGFELAIDARPLEQLRRQVEALPARARRTPLKGVQSLERARRKVERAAGNAPKLAAALGALERTFTRVTGEAATRSAGETYAGRTVVYEECRRALELSAGEELRALLAAPLQLLLPAARWYTARIGALLNEELLAVHRQLGGGEVSLARLWEASAHLFERLPPPAVAQAVKELQRKWKRLLPMPANEKEVRFDCARLAPKVARAFRAESPGWPGARHHAPDVMLARTASGWLPVLGEVHPGVTPFCTLSVLSHCPVRAQLEALFAEDLGGGHLHTIPFEPFARSTHDLRLAPDAFHLDVGMGWSSPRPPEQVLRSAELWVVRLGSRLQVRTADRRHCFDALDVFERRIKLKAANHFTLLPPAPHRPRVRFDSVVVARESWRFTAEQLTFAAAPTPSARFLEARRWARAAGLPRWVFARSPHEVKPVFVDLDSPALVEVLAKQARGADSFTVTEMLPTPDQAWLEDAAGARYAAELRMLAVDPIAFADPPRHR
ncbi:MAG: hypothetical protein H6Q89_1241 [Myxococcaceae bacterium]|nr:hypothetical protein [Myxococcaceae bacterium]